MGSIDFSGSIACVDRGRGAKGCWQRIVMINFEKRWPRFARGSGMILLRLLQTRLDLHILVHSSVWMQKTAKNNLVLEFTMTITVIATCLKRYDDANLKSPLTNWSRQVANYPSMGYQSFIKYHLSSIFKPSDKHLSYVKLLGIHFGVFICIFLF